MEDRQDKVFKALKRAPYKAVHARVVSCHIREDILTEIKAGGWTEADFLEQFEKERIEAAIAAKAEEQRSRLALWKFLEAKRVEAPRIRGT